MTLFFVGNISLLSFSFLIPPVANAIDYSDPFNSTLQDAADSGGDGSGPVIYENQGPLVNPNDVENIGPANSFVNCGTGTAGPADCKLPDLLNLVNKVLQFIIVDVMLTLSTIVIVYAGIKTLIESSQGKDATVYKKMLTNVAIGMFFVLGSFVIVKSLLTMLIRPNTTFYQAMLKALQL